MPLTGLRTKREIAIQDGIDRERQRCLSLVASYRASIQIKFAAQTNPTEQHKAVVARVVAALLDIEKNIKHPVAAPVSVVMPGDFSIEEMERAQEIIAEQEHNPFEG